MSNKRHKARMAEIAKVRAFQDEAPAIERRIVKNTSVRQEYVGLGTRFIPFKAPDAEGRKGIVVKYRKYENVVSSRDCAVTTRRKVIEIECSIAENKNYSWCNAGMGK